MPSIAALFVDCMGIYRDSFDCAQRRLFTVANTDVDVWCIHRDARNYPGPWPVVAHPPCQRWGRLAKACYGRYPRKEMAVGNDDGCFQHALRTVRAFGGVIEHPAGSLAFEAFNLPRPSGLGWKQCSSNEWVCEVWQSAYGHLAAKATWLFYVGGCQPMPMRWERRPGTHQIGFQDARGKSRNKPTVSRKQACATPPEFSQALIALARNVY